MRSIPIIFILLLLSAPSVQGELSPGAATPNPTLTAQDGSQIPLHKMFGLVTVLHLWKCD